MHLDTYLSPIFVVLRLDLLYYIFQLIFFLKYEIVVLLLSILFGACVLRSLWDTPPSSYYIIIKRNSS